MGQANLTSVPRLVHDDPRALASRYAVLALCVLAAGLRLWDAAFNFDGDELFSVKLASGSSVDVVQRALADRPHPPLYYLLLHIWMRAFGPHEASVRVLSVVFAVVFILLSFKLFRRFMPTPSALFALGILVASPLFVYYGQQARPYSLVAMLAVGNLLAFLRTLDRPGRSQLVLWALSCALLLYSQYMGVLLIAAEILYALLSRSGGRMAIVAWGLIGCLSISPWAVTAFGPSIGRGVDPLNQINWMERPGPIELPWFYISIFGTNSGVPSRWLVLLLVGLGIACTWRFLSSKRALPRHLPLLVIIAFGLPGLVFAISLLGPKPVFAPRQLLVSGVALVALVAIALAWLPRLAGQSVALLLLVWTVASMPSSLPHHANPPWRAMAQYLDRDFSHEDAVVEESWIGDPLAFYRRAGAVVPVQALGLEQRDAGFLFICRMRRCSSLGNDEFAGRARPLSVWAWGDGDPSNDRDHLRVYRVLKR